MTQERTPAVDTDMDWSPFGGVPVQGTSRTDGKVDTDARRSTVRADASGWNPRVIDGGRGHSDAPVPDPVPADNAVVSAMGEDGPGVDVLDAAAADVLAIMDVPPTSEPVPAAVEPQPERKPEVPARLPEPPTAAPEAPAVALQAAPAAAPVPAHEPDSTPHTPHPDPDPTVSPAPAHSATGAAEAPHSTPRWRTAVGWLNLYDILDQPAPPIRDIYRSAWDSAAARNGADRFLDIVIVCGIGVPVSIAARILDAAGHSKGRLAGMSATAALWTVTAATAPVDASTLAWWTVAGYWVSTVIVIPAVIKATE